MYSQIPLPTDNLYKFHALCGAFLLSFSFAAVIVNNNGTNNVIVGDAVEIAQIKQQPQKTLSQEVKAELLRRRMDIAIADRKNLSYLLAALSVVGFIQMFYGFDKWKKVIQPTIDKMAEIQLETAKVQLEILQIELKDKMKASADAQDSNAGPEAT